MAKIAFINGELHAEEKNPTIRNKQTSDTPTIKCSTERLGLQFFANISVVGIKKMKKLNNFTG